eukprot:s251_g19.t1
MEDPMTSRGSKRACTNHVDTEMKYVSSWKRMCSKLKIQEHMDLLLKLTVGLAVPLMTLLMRVLALMMRVADMDEVETLQVVMNNMVVEKKKQEKGLMTGQKGYPVPQNLPMGKSKSKTSSLGSFSVVSEGSHNTYASHRSQEEIYQAPASSSQSALQEKHLCFCGLKPIKYTCRKQGHNYMREFYRCPKEPQSVGQCHYFQWLQETKGEEYERMYACSQGSKKQPNMAVKSKKPYEDDFSSCGEPEPASASPPPRQPRGSPKTSIYPPPPPQMECNHEWNRRGSNAHIKMKTCHKCGFQETLRYKDNHVTQCYVDVTNLKKSGRPRAVSP